MHGGCHIFARFHFVISFFMRAPSGPLIPFGDMGTLWAPIFKNKINLALQDSNLHFDVMNIKFYLLSQEFELETHCWWGGRHVVEGAGDGVGGHDVATTCSLQTHPHTLQGHPLNLGLNYRAPHLLIFFFF